MSHSYSHVVITKQKLNKLFLLGIVKGSNP